MKQSHRASNSQQFLPSHLDDPQAAKFRADAFIIPSIKPTKAIEKR
jgi:hypothetical protein